ncbi:MULTISPECIES: substrate-binding domain-containing protein [Actinosynnema]|uniref:substrate-binding domain-containing protein n=1 Tax=Actinosynnema TaxID=40566 RepID=UPI0020A5B74C|nr:substrate-binding domain-containing protein [Actinosynnema pretiosum]MCP2092314.1 phosphate transport system substrate-binding protein [Actinosynnema pretiosum]
MRSTLIKAAVVAVALVSAAGAAQADPASGVVPSATDLVGVGSDTSQDALNLLAGHYNATSPAAKVHSWNATGTSPITPKAGAPSITRPNGSSAGISALIADGTAHNLDFARSSRKPRATESNYAFIEFARDTVTYATATTSTVPTTLTTLQLNQLYSSAAGSAACAYNAYLPQDGSGTRSFFLESIGVSSPGTCAKSVFNGSPVQEHSAAPVLNDPTAIVPFSVGRAVGLSGIKVNSVNDDVRPVGKPAAETATVRPSDGQLAEPGQTAVKAYDRGLYNVIRVTDQTVSKFSSFFGTLGWVCNSVAAENDLIASGFRLSDNCGVRA